MDCCSGYLAILSLVLVVVYFALRRFISGLRIDRFTDVYVLITGCDTGFGNDAAKRFDRMGCHVFAGCLTEKGRESLKHECSDRLHAISLDVTKIESIREAYDYVKTNIPKGLGLWGVINNAGVFGRLGALEWFSIEMYREVADINLYGLINVTMTFLPLVKKARGRIVNTASILGRMSASMLIPYNVSKYGVEAFTDGLRRSMRPYGVKAVLIEPGAHSTPLTAPQNLQTQLTAAWNNASAATKAEFGEEYMRGVVEYFGRLTKGGSSGISGVVDAYEQGLLGRYPRARYLVGKDCFTLFLPIQALPEWLGDWLFDVLVKPPKPAVLK